MNTRKLVVWLVAAVIAAGVVWRLYVFFGATMDWPLVILNAKSDALAASQENGNYVDAKISDGLEEHLKSKGVVGQVSLTSANAGTEAAVVVNGLSERACKGLERHPELEKAFERIQVVGGACAENVSMLFWFK
ncbi:MAG TPA: hypothetical protein VM661_04440 [Candidatus Sulfotelmatobacter sp.]|jgi:hypothetical protein|nr:hypothetical protein [Candidatus Sulfotelmatobacter sp.]